MDFGNRSGAWAYTTMDHQTKFNAYKVTGIPQPNPTSYVVINDIYKLPGTIPNPNPSDINNITVEQKSDSPFPNPASSFVTLPYSLKPNESSSMRIFNSAGQLIETFQILGTSNQLNISIEKYIAGIYIYEYNGLTNTFIVK